MKKKWSIEKILWLFLMVFSILIVLFPIYIMFKYSISDRASWITGWNYFSPWWLFAPCLAMYNYYLSDGRFWSSAWCIVKIACLTIIISMGLGASAAFALARFQFWGIGIVL